MGSSFKDAMRRPTSLSADKPFANARLLLHQNTIPGDFTYNGYLCRSARLPPNPGAIWLSSDLVWQQHGRRVASGGNTVVAPCEGLIWLGDLALLNSAGEADVDPYAQFTAFHGLEFSANHGSGGIGGLVQPLIGERIFGTLKPNRG